VTAELWDAPTAAAPVRASARVPGSKSVTNRALVLGALSEGRSVLHQPLRSRDTLLMARALTSLGAEVVHDDDETWQVAGARWRHGPGTVDVGNAGTVLRFVPALAGLAAGPTVVLGDDAASRRPVGPLLAALRELGVGVEGDAVPFTVTGSGAVRGGAVTLDASSSSQLVSALLLAGPAFDAGVEVRHDGPRAVPNANHLAMTAAMLRERGVGIDVGPDRWAVRPGPVRAWTGTIEPDLSSAAPFLAAAVATSGEVTVPDWPAGSTQPGARLPELLAAFGADSSHDDAGMTVRGAGRITGADLDLRDVGELTPVLAALAALAATPSRLTGIDYLRGHETDRLAALARELGGLGADVRELPDGLEIRPAALHGGTFETYDDHRMAMAGAVVGLAVPGVRVVDVATTAKTFPGFAGRWAELVGAADPAVVDAP
jgi:3-phosphoshikimate 1-carboxyvinyltransferase